MTRTLSLSYCSGLVLGLAVAIVAANLQQKESASFTVLPTSSTGVHRVVESVTFLVTVNDTWETGGCLETVKTPPIRPDTPWNESQSITVGKCDHGPLTYTLTHIGKKTTTLQMHCTIDIDMNESTSWPPLLGSAHTVFYKEGGYTP